MTKKYTLFKNTLFTLITFASAQITSAQQGELIWEDNFDTFDTNVWNSITGNGCEIGLCGWGNAELEYYTPDNISIEDIADEPGNKALVLTAKPEVVGDNEFTSGKVDSERKLSVQYGLIEIRIKTPDLKTGLWPAAWLLGTANTSWPSKGEIDMMEMGHGVEDREFQGFFDVDTNSYVGANAIFANEDGGAGLIAYDVNYNQPYVSETPMNDRFVTYKLYWDNESMRFTVLDNNIEHDLYTSPLSLDPNGVTAAFTKPFYFLLNLAVGGNFTDASKSSEVTASLPAKLYIDYVRIYEWNGQGTVNLNYDQLPTESGSFGVYTEETKTDNELNFGTDAEVYVWGNTMTETDIAPYEGNQTLAWQTLNKNSWFGGGITASYGRDMSNYVDNGSLKFNIKIPADIGFKIGITDNYTNESFLEFPAGETKYGLTRNGEWGQVEIPLTDFAGVIAFQDINYMFSIANMDTDIPETVFEFAVDNIYWEESSSTNGTLSNEDFDIANKDLQIYPIPAKNYVNVSIPYIEKHTIIQIIDLGGKIVYSKSSISKDIAELNIGNLKPGFYMVKLFNDFKNTKVYKLIKE